MKPKTRFHKLTAWLLTLAMLMTFVPGFTIGVSAAEDQGPYYGDTPRANGYYYWYPSGRGYYALADELIKHNELYRKFNNSGQIHAMGNINCRTDYSSGAGTSDIKFIGKSEMADKWKISSFDVSFSMPYFGDKETPFKTRNLEVLLGLKETGLNGSSSQYYFSGRAFNRTSYPPEYYFTPVSDQANSTTESGRKIATYTARLNNTVSNVTAVFADNRNPTVRSWSMQNRENDTPLLWMIFSEELFPADENLLNRQLLSEAFKLELLMTPRIDPNATPEIINATCVEFVTTDSGNFNGNGSGRLGFEINDEDWQQLQNSHIDWVIRTVNVKFDTSKSYDIRFPYPLRDYVKNYHNSSENYSTVYPIVDTVGNPINVAGSYNNLKIEIDTVDPYATDVFLRGDSLPAVDTSNIDLDSWEEVTDIKWSDLFLGKGDSFYAEVELNEQIRELTEEQKSDIYLEWNVNDKRGNAIRTKLSRSELAPYVNGTGNISRLVFEPLSIDSIDIEESGKHIKPVKLHGAYHLQDFTNNSMTELETENGVYTLPVSPNMMVFFDLKGPVVTLGNVVKGDLDGDSLTYYIELDISDKTSDEENRYFAGMVGGESPVMGSFSIYSDESLPSFDYSYSLTSADTEFDGNYTSQGSITGKNAQSPSPISVLKEGSYILYLKIDSIEGVEIPDDTGVTIDFTVWDILNNLSEQSVSIDNLELDKVAPTMTATGSTNVISTSEENSAVFGATVTANDLNGVTLIEYKWASEGVVEQYVPENGKNVSYTIPTKNVSGTGVIEETLEITVYDKYNNKTSKTLSYSADLSKYIPQFSYSENPNLPSFTSDVIISAPINTEVSGATDGYIRVVYFDEDTSEYYVGTAAIGADETVSIFGEGLTWVKTTVSDGNCGEITAVSDISFLTDIYGDVEFTIWASKNELSVSQGTPIDPSAADSYAQKTTATLARTTERDDAHNISFGNVTLSSGEALTVSTYGEGTDALEYHKLFLDEFVGARYPFSISNAIRPEWTTVDVDWENSYAVLLKANSDGTLPEDDEEVIERVPLSAGINHSLVIPGLDKEGQIFTTGVYVWKVYIAQKAGGSCEFVAPTRLLVDAVELDAEFGVYSYSTYVSFGCDPYSVDTGTDYLTDNGFYMTQENQDGSPLSVINVALAENTSTPTVVQDEYGDNAFAYVNLNSTKFLEFDIVINREKLEDQTYIGEDFGVIEGFRYWNAGAPVDLEALPFELDIDDDGIRGLHVNQDLREYMVDMCIIVDDLSELEPAKSHDDFRIIKGRNRIAYQMKLTNGEISPVMYLDVVARTVAPTVNVSFTPGPGREETVELEGEEAFTQYHASYVTASVTDYSSVSGSLDFYQLTYSDRGNYTCFVFSEIEDPSNITLIEGSDGYEGIPTGYEYDPAIKDYFFAVDAYGNSVMIFPIIGDTDNVGDPNFKNLVINGLGKIGSLEVTNAYDYDVNEKGRYELTVNHTYTNRYHENDEIIRVMDGYSVQLDDRTPVYIDATGVTDIVDGTNDAGIVAVYNHGAVEFSFPYDPQKALGEESTHTVTVRAYLNGAVTDEKSVKVWNVPNLRPTMTVYQAALGNSIFVSKHTNLTDEQLANGEYSGSEMRFALADTKPVGEEHFGNQFTITTMDGGNYTIEYMDKFGNIYTQDMATNLPDDPKVEISTTEPTAGPVTVTITSEQFDLSIEGVPSYQNPDYFAMAVPTGTVVDGNGTKTLKLTLYNNSDRFDMTNPDDPTSWYSYEGVPIVYGENKRISIIVDNIYNEPVRPVIKWTYAPEEVLETYEQGGVTYHNVVLGTVDAVLLDENDIPLIDPATGETPRFTFEPGGATRYIFSGYTNIAGVEGEAVTAELPVTLMYHITLPVDDTPEIPADVWDPNVAINGFATYATETLAVTAAYINESVRDAESPIADIVSDWVADWSNTYGNDFVFTDIDELIACYGWAEAYKLNVNILDESATKIFITTTDYTSVPAYENGTSESIDGVSLIGRSVAITKNCSFVIHVVDEANNSTSIPVSANAVGTDAPAPGHMVVLSKDSTQVRVYLIPPNIGGVDNLQITTGTFDPHPDSKVETDTASAFYGMPYIVYTENGAQNLCYSYELGGILVTGSISFKIDKINKSGLTLLGGYPKWSANYDANATADNLDELFIKMTNQSITAQLAFNKTLSDAYFVDESGTRVTSLYATVAFLGSQATVEYAFNEAALKLVCVSATNSNQTYTVELPAIVTIDKHAPAVFDSDVSYDSNYKNATISLKVSEQAMLQSNGKYLERVEDAYPYYTATDKVDSNGEYSFVFVDRAGNRVEKKVKVTDIVSGELAIELSSTADGSAGIDSDTYTPNVGDVIYVKINRDAEITVDNTDAKISANAEEWTAVTILESLSGLYPTIRAEDAYGNTAIVQLKSVPLGDGTAPTVIVRKQLVSIPLDSNTAETEQILKANIIASDDMTPSGQLVYSFTYTRPTSGGTVNVTYSVADSFGNTTSENGYIRFYGNNELVVKVNGEAVERDSTAIVKKGSIDLFVDSIGEPYKIMWKTGIKTVAQVKINASTLTAYTDTAKSYTPDFTDVGYYTVVVTTQSQNTYRIILYVEN